MEEEHGEEELDEEHGGEEVEEVAEALTALPNIMYRLSLCRWHETVYRRCGLPHWTQFIDSREDRALAQQTHHFAWFIFIYNENRCVCQFVTSPYLY